MNKISGSTFYFKVIFPFLWFGVLLLIVIVAITSERLASFALLFPVALAIFGFVLFKHLVWNLADEVFDAGDRLIFRKGQLEQVVRLTDILNIDYAHLSSPERVIVHCSTPGQIGSELTFSLPMRLRLFSKSPVVTELIERVDRARCA